MSVCYYNAMVRIHGIDGPLLLWFRNFLPNGMQSFVLRVICSDYRMCPKERSEAIMFIIYVNNYLIYVTMVSR